METIKLDKSNIYNTIKLAQSKLEQGGLVVYPTETCYGIGCDATNPDAVARLIEYKSKRDGKPISIAVCDRSMADKYVEVNSIAENLYENFLPGPLTVVSKSKGTVAKRVESEFGTVGVRIPAYHFVIELVRSFGKPITATSANASYKKRPYEIQDILENISQKQKDLIDLIIDAGKLPPNPPSTVVDTTLNEAVVLRQGNIHLTEIMKVESKSPEATQEVGEDIVKRYSQFLGYKSLIIALQGELGAGKTEMTKGIAKALDIKSRISSPTYTIEQVYKVNGKEESFLASRNLELYHVDVWRLFDENELLELDFKKQVDEGNIFVIEWADKVANLLESVSDEAVIVWVKIDYGTNENERVISISDYGESSH